MMKKTIKFLMCSMDEHLKSISDENIEQQLSVINLSILYYYIYLLQVNYSLEGRKELKIFNSFRDPLSIEKIIKGSNSKKNKLIMEIISLEVVNLVFEKNFKDAQILYQQIDKCNINYMSETRMKIFLTKKKTFLDEYLETMKADNYMEHTLFIQYEKQTVRRCYK
ncbi:hypothetical protein ACT7DJ_13955 [Bacillus cereus]